MIDMHYDLLSVAYKCYKLGDYSYLINWSKNYNDNNVTGCIANLYFMSRVEMQNDLGNYYDPDVSVLDMFLTAVKVVKKYLPSIDFVFSIEGCDYIKDTNELVELHKNGLRNILLVWNNPNLYGSGNNGSYGLTDMGCRFLRCAIDLGICIDLSHMNINTFNDTISLLKDEKRKGKNVKVIVSHSNCYDIWNHPRNLTDQQLMDLKELDAVVGLVSYTRFIGDESYSMERLENIYLDHIDRIVSILGIDHVGVSSDDMTFGFDLLNDDRYAKQLFKYDKIANDLTKLLSRKYNKEEIDKILYKNIYNKLF